MEGTTATSSSIDGHRVTDCKDGDNDYNTHHRKCYLGDNNQSFLQCFPGTLSFCFLRLASFTIILISATIICPWSVKRYDYPGKDIYAEHNCDFLVVYSTLMMACLTITYFHAYLLYPQLYKRLASSIGNLQQCHGKVFNLIGTITEDELLDTYDVLFTHEIEYSWPETEPLESSIVRITHTSNDSNNCPVTDSPSGGDIVQPIRYYLKVQNSIQTQDPTDITPVEGENTNVYIHPSYPRCAYTEDNMKDKDFLRKPDEIKLWCFLLNVFIFIPQGPTIFYFKKYPWQTWFSFAIFVVPSLCLFEWTMIRQLEYKFYNQANVRDDCEKKHRFVNWLSIYMVSIYIIICLTVLYFDTLIMGY